jgi:hypothetical protein
MSERRLRIASAIACALLTLGGVAPGAAAQPLFAYEALPELPGAASEAYDAAPEDENPGSGMMVVGRALDGDGLWKAVVWTRDAGALIWELTVLPNPFGATESAALCFTAYIEELFRRQIICGHAIDEDGHPQPVVWTKDDGGLWSAEIAPVPPPYDTGGIQFMDKAQLVDLEIKMTGAVGTSDGSTARHAVMWTRDLEGGGWSVDLLPDYGPAFASRATGTGRTTGHVAELSIGGHVQPDTGAGIQPSVWDVLPGGVISRIDLPLAPGAYRGSIEALASGAFGGLAAVGYNAHPGTVDSYKPIVHARTGGVWGDALELAPLPGQRDARAASALPGRAGSADGLTVLGGSYSELAPGDGSRATLWEIAAGGGQPELAATYDLADLVVDLPPSIMLGMNNPGTWLELPPTPRASPADTIFEQTVFVAGISTLAGDPGATPHAHLLTSLPEPTGTALLGCGGALLALLARRRARSQNVGAGSELTIHIA